MRKSFLSSLFMLYACCVFAQANFQTACRYIKAGNTLREAQQFETAESYIRNGLSTVQATSGREARYWEAVAFEYLALLNRDQENGAESIRDFNKAIRLYRDNGYMVSATALNILLGAVNETEEAYCGIDVGAKGVKLSVVMLRLGRNGDYYYRIVHKETINPQASAGSDRAFTETAAAIRAFVDTARARGIPQDRTFVVISSGLAQALNQKDSSRLGQLQQVLAKEVASYKTPIPVISAEEEGRMVTKGVIPSRFLYNSTSIDIGSGNTKGGYFARDKTFEPLSFNYGTVTLTDAIKAQNAAGAPYADAASSFFEAKVRPMVRTELGRKPGFKNRRNIFLMGGCTWALVTYLYPEKAKESFVSFTLNDVKKLRKMATENYAALINPDLSALDNDPVLRSAAEADIREVRDKVFNQENIIAGSMLLEGIMTELNGSSPDKVYYFPRYGVVGWITGFVIQSVADNLNGRTE